MTDLAENGTQPEQDLGPLPDVVQVKIAYFTRMPNQRVVDLLARIEPMPFGELMTTQQNRVCAFRKLIADHPNRDPTSLWLHAYDVEVEIVDALDPTAVGALTSTTTVSPPSVDTGVTDPTSSTT